MKVSENSTQNDSKDLLINFIKPSLEEKPSCLKNLINSVSTEPLFNSQLFSTLNSGCVSVETSPHFKPSTADSSYCDPANSMNQSIKLFNNIPTIASKEKKCTEIISKETPIWGLLAATQSENKGAAGKSDSEKATTNNDRLEELEAFKLEAVQHVPERKNSMSNGIPRRKDLSFGFQPLDIGKNHYKYESLDCTPLKKRNEDISDIKSDNSFSSSTSPKRGIPISISTNQLTSYDRYASPACENIRKRRNNSPGFFDKMRNHCFKGPLEKGSKNMDENEVKLVQIALNQLIIEEEVETNGHYGLYTEKLVKIFQERNYLPVNGVVTSEVWDLIKGELFL